MAHFQRMIMNHLKQLNENLKHRGATATISLPGAALQLRYLNRIFDFQPQFIVKNEQKRSMSFEFSEKAVAFCGWLPYFNKRWPEAISKLSFKTYAEEHGINTPQHYVDHGNYEGVLVKRNRSSFADGMRGPFKNTVDDFEVTSLQEGEYYEQFILGSVLKAWIWNGKPVCVELAEMTHITGDGKQTARELLAPRIDRALMPVPKGLIECLVAYQGKNLDSVLASGEKLYVDYRYGSPLAETEAGNRNVFPSLDKSLLNQLEEASRTLEQSIPLDIRQNTLFTLDAVVDAQNKIWVLEINCNPSVHPDVYPVMFDSLLGDADVIPDSHKPRHLQNISSSPTSDSRELAPQPTGTVH